MREERKGKTAGLHEHARGHEKEKSLVVSLMLSIRRKGKGRRGGDSLLNKKEFLLLE